MRHEFAPQDLSEFGPGAVYVHIHPKDLEGFVELDRSQLPHPEIADKLNKFIVVTPSRADIQLMLEMTKSSKGPIDTEFVIVHSLGLTRVKLKGERAKIESLGQQIQKRRDDVIADHRRNLPQFRQMSLIPAVEQLIGSLDQDLGDEISIVFEPKP